MEKIEAKAEVTGSVWKIVAEVGSRLEAGDTIMILESMKMEIPVLAEEAGTLAELSVAEGAAVSEGQVVAVLES
ncbi:biotin/lipoyl-binding carrier protein [Piscinibacter koreensis]|uniref:biotin/lipoyl-binding carrier protein n=1 Tax=Piscinibacter koreensis TaxID=2742824 RepID=UPI001C37B4A5|nr:biotin/lipoyl-binding carrier protein [Schlegelella koreensis]